MSVANRQKCPCCAYPTLVELGGYEICDLCGWEDDGQGDADADKVRGGPNSDYSLTEARTNFAKYRVMYAPGRDQRGTGADSLLEYETKAKLMAAFERWHSASEGDRVSWEHEIFRLERILEDEMYRMIREVEEKNQRDV